MDKERMEEVTGESTLQPENIPQKPPFWQNPKIPIVVGLVVVGLTILGVSIVFCLKATTPIPSISSLPTPQATPSSVSTPSLGSDKYGDEGRGFMKPEPDTIREWLDLYKSAPPAHFDYCFSFGGECISIHKECEGTLGGLKEVSCGSTSMKCCLPEKCQPDKIIYFRCEDGNKVPWCECTTRGDDWYCVDSPQERLCGKPTCDERCRQEGYSSGVCRQPRSFPDFCLSGEDYIGNASDCYSFTSGINGEKLGGASKACCCR